ncbi:tetratricopeptide repeat protein, partial [Candidatus Woesearchaeota archaeon]|nr:tetratricopeptide repeat protein [Candidatus Woesearchaeota archaeon]
NKAAMPLYDAIIEQEPSAEAYHGRGWTNYFLNHPRKAINDFAEAIELTPIGREDDKDNEKRKEALFSDQYERLAEYHFSKGLAHKKMKHLNKAFKEMETANSLYFLCQLQAVTREVSKVGDMLEEPDRFDEAVKNMFGYNGNTSVCQRAAENTKYLDRNHPAVNLQMADISGMRGDIDKAIEYMKKATEYDPENAVNHNILGNLHISQSEGRAINEETVKNYLEPALMSFTRAHVNDSKNPTYLLNRGLTLSILGLQDEALEDLEKARQIDPENSEAYTALGQVFQRTGHHDSARIRYHQAIKFADKSDNPDYQESVEHARQGLEEIEHMSQ